MHAIVAVVGCVGCAGGPMSWSLSRDCLVAIRYECLAAPEWGRGTGAGIAADFREIRTLGFNAVWLDFLPPAEGEVVAGLAEAAGLRGVRSDATLDRYVLVGCLPPGAGSIRDVVIGRAGQRFSRRPGVIVAMPPFPSSEMVGRIREVVTALAGLHPPCETLVVGCGSDAVGFGDLPTLWYAAWGVGEASGWDGGATRPRMIALVGQDRIEEPFASVERTRLTYHRAVAAGLTGGLLVWRYRSWPGESNGLALDDGVVPASTMRVVKSLTHRVAEWAPLLAGTCVVRDVPPMLESRQLRCRVYQRADRRVVVIHNEDAERFGRGSLRVPAELAGRPVLRLVARENGARYTRTEAPLTIPICVAPAEATVFEVY